MKNLNLGGILLRYKGNKALMKCCKSCTDKKGIKCFGNRKIIKHDGYKFCKNHNPKINTVKKRILSIAHLVEFNKKIDYYSTAAKETLNDTVEKLVELEVKQVVQSSTNGLRKILNYVRKVVLNLASKSKEIQETH